MRTAAIAEISRPNAQGIIPRKRLFRLLDAARKQQILWFFENLYARFKPPVAVVFDNYQEVAEDSPLHGVMQTALSIVPEGVRVFILSRNDPPAAFSRLRANNAVRIVGWDELRFTRNETQCRRSRKQK